MFEHLSHGRKPNERGRANLDLGQFELWLATGSTMELKQREVARYFGGMRADHCEQVHLAFAVVHHVHAGPRSANGHSRLRGTEGN